MIALPVFREIDIAFVQSPPFLPIQPIGLDSANQSIMNPSQLTARSHQTDTVLICQPAWRSHQYGHGKNTFVCISVCHSCSPCDFRRVPQLTNHRSRGYRRKLHWNLDIVVPYCWILQHFKKTGAHAVQEDRTDYLRRPSSNLRRLRLDYHCGSITDNLSSEIIVAA